MSNQSILWIAFGFFVLVMLALDLGVFHRKSHRIGMKEALIWSGIWIALALLFNSGIYFWLGSEKALNFFTSYLIEKSLSVDNLFVFLMIFSYFGVPSKYQHKVLFWGIVGALVMRLIFIFTGIALIEKFHWIIYVFGAFLIFTGAKMAREKQKKVDPDKNPVLRFLRRALPITTNYVGDKFYIKKAGGYLFTPLFVVLIVIETTDVMFATDSIPAVLAITVDPFIVFSSNVFAILGLRALYFALSGVMQLFRYLHYGLASILVFVGAKMLISDIYKIPVGIALSVVAGILIAAIMISVLYHEKKPEKEPAEVLEEDVKAMH